MSKNKTAARHANFARFSLPLGLTLSLPQLLRAEDQVDYRYEYYKEDNNRMSIDTHSVYCEQKLVDAIIAKGDLVYASISGATPTGGYNGNKVLTTQLWDIRRAMNLSLDGRLGNQTISPGFAYSEEHDYQSYGVSLNDAIELNEKNTVLSFGISQKFDNVRNGPTEKLWTKKYSTEALVGVTQLLSPKTTFNAAFTFGNDSGYLNDPYRVINFSLSGFAYPEVRPRHRNKEVLFFDLNHFFDCANAAGDLSYRFYHDSYGIIAHTVEATWTQHLGKYVILEPLARFYEQSAANFYQTSVNGYFPTDPLPRPTFYSADYRLSNLATVTYGTQITLILKEHFYLDLGYHRYEMFGLDSSTPSAAYPKANIFTVGARFTW